MMRSDNIRWWGGRWHTLFTILVFITLVSLDNTARGIISPLYAVIARDLLVTEAALGRITAINILVVVFTSVGWGYWGDRGNRKSLLFYGTLLWSAAFYLSANAETYNQLLLWQTVAAVGLGCISSVGFSVVSDFIPAHRRGIALSFWGISQAG
ncbi:MAG: MFS transporter, partial [Chloroflexota bacterium]